MNNTTNRETPWRKSINFYRQKERAMKEKPVDKQIRTIDNMNHPCHNEEMCYYMCPHCTCGIYSHKISCGHLCYWCKIIEWENKFNRNILFPAKEKMKKRQNRASRIRSKLTEAINRRDMQMLVRLSLRLQKADKKFRKYKRLFNRLEKRKFEHLRYMDACYSSTLNTA